MGNYTFSPLKAIIWYFVLLCCDCHLFTKPVKYWYLPLLANVVIAIFMSTEKNKKFKKTIDIF